MPLPAWNNQSFGQIVINIIIIAAIVACLYAALQFFGIAIPHLIVTLSWIVLAAFAVILAIKFLMNMSWGPGPNP